MTELKQYLAMLDRALIPYEIHKFREDQPEFTTTDVDVERGYEGHFTSCTFDCDEMLIDVGAYDE